MFRIVIVAILFHICWSLTSDQEYASVPFTNFEDEPAEFIDKRLPKGYQPKEQKERRRIFNDNFIRIGRGGGEIFLPFPSDYDFEYDDVMEQFARPTRAHDNSDNFIRLGRNRDNFLRFGKAATKARDQNFLRFGRSILESQIPKKRSRRDVMDKFEPAVRRNDRTGNFLRFGKGGGENFMRFGRTPENEKAGNDASSLAGEQFQPLFQQNTRSHEARQSTSDYPHSSKIKLLQNSPLFHILRQLELELRENN